MAANEFRITSRLNADAATVWSTVCQMDQVNRELGPWFKMTAPRPGLVLDDPEQPVGERRFRSWLLLFGVLPVDYDDLVLQSVEPGRAFHERSSMLSQRAWNHDRTVDPDGDGCVVTDEVSWEPRFPGAGALMRLVAPRLFRWRHRRLRQRFGHRAPAQT